ncbi:hypothetical protein ABZV75_34135 [Streptomyces flaveolus]|uniref:hypothetical protein n=1 Tax=Streptomyces flaveolus TaxID=67297 RepID=UPI0033A05963
MTSQSTATLRSRYVEQAASDLEENRRRQQELAQTIKMLKREEALLVDILALAERHEGDVSEAPTLPEQAQDEPAVRRARTAGAQTGTRRRKARGKSRQPLLADLLLELLRAQDQPRFAKELRDELLAKHPDRSPTPQVVRNTLESLVAKGRIRRHKHERSVTYTVA